MKLQFILKGLPPDGFIKYSKYRTCVIQTGPTLFGEYPRDVVLFVDRFSQEMSKENYVVKYKLKKL
jgi:hypothetical protein